MKVRKCDRCGKEIKTSMYFFTVHKSSPKADIETLKDYVLLLKIILI